MAVGSYDADAELVAVSAVQYTGANLADVQTICRDAREDPTMQKVVLVPDTRGRKRVLHIGDWIFSVATGVFVVVDNATFDAIFNETE